jgi:hypothetical protein
MPRTSTLTLVAPRLFEHLRHRSVGPPLSKDSILEVIAGRGHLERRWHADSFEQARLKPWQRGLLNALELDERSYPSASLSALGVGISGMRDGTGDWFHAEPIHLAAGMKDVTLVPLRLAAALTTEERRALTSTLQEHLTNDGCDLHPNASNEWLLGSTRPFNVQTVCAEYAMRNEWSAVLPQGAGAGQVRRLMTELQMLLHDHPINEARVARGVPTVNALWLWGNGAVGSARDVAQSRACYGGDDYLRGICKANRWHAPPSNASIDSALAQVQNGTAIVYVVTDPVATEFEERWLSPSLAALKRGAIARLELVIDEWHLTIDRWQLRKFWRGASPIDAWAHA